jgi:hypothetical protein
MSISHHQEELDIIMIDRGTTSNRIDRNKVVLPAITKSRHGGTEGQIFVPFGVVLEPITTSTGKVKEDLIIFGQSLSD